MGLRIDKTVNLWLTQLYQRMDKLDGTLLSGYPKVTQHFIRREAKNGMFLLEEADGETIVRSPANVADFLAKTYYKKG